MVCPVAPAGDSVSHSRDRKPTHDGDSQGREATAVSPQHSWQTQETPATDANGPGAWSTLCRSVNVQNHIPRFVRWLLRPLLPGAGRHRAGGTSTSVTCVDAPTLRLPRVHQVHRMSDRPPLRGEGVRLVRPYPVAHERRKDVPRVELLCAPHGMVVVR
ncbi:hypothetical protein SSPO_048980 [Streptomyces antimycoticus]|uniref:Uncharacterized protein n=1 Tax=Streptomyces antimycoticus TaxID=68175 RepID=A0A499UNS0_9ACTN|nr:hypothetical protein SSPO_048980 [Streptomyces antimycoticus]